MFANISIENFRSFRNLRVEPLARINLVSGKNNVGKSSLLEALLLLGRGGDQSTILRLNQFRSMSDRIVSSETAATWLFHCANAPQTAKIVGKSATAPGDDHRLELSFFHSASAVEIDDSDSNRPSLLSVVKSYLQNARSGAGVYLRFKSKGAEGYGFFHFDLAAAAVKNLLPLNSDSVGRWFAVGHAPHAWKSAQLVDYRSWDRAHDLDTFSSLRSDGRDKPVLDALNAIDSNLEGLEVLVAGGEPEFYGRMRGSERLLPIWTFGEGFRHLLSIVTAVASCRNSIVLIDEIENGLHYSVLPHVWTAISKAAEEANVQVFATTHSRECVVAAHEALSQKGEDEFRVHRLERGRSGEVEAITYDRDSLAFSLEQGWEVR